MKTALNLVAEKLATWAGVRRTGMARTGRIVLWLVFLAACNVGEAYKVAPRAAAGIMREVKGV